MTAGVVLDGGTHATVGRYASTDGDGLDARGLDSLAEFVHQDFDDGALQRGGQVGLVLLDEVGILLKGIAQGVEERRLQAAEAVVIAIDMRFGKLEGLVVALGCQAVDDGATGIRQAHDLGALVEGLARGIVDGLSQHLHVTRTIDLDDLANCRR